MPLLKKILSQVGVSSEQATKTVKVFEMKPLKDLGNFSLQKRQLRYDMVVDIKDVKGCHKEEGMGLFSFAPENRTRNRLVLWFRLAVQKNLLTIEQAALFSDEFSCTGGFPSEA